MAVPELDERLGLDSRVRGNDGEERGQEPSSADCVRARVRCWGIAASPPAPRNVHKN